MSADQVLDLLSTLTSRLEDVTQRLEKLEGGAASSSGGSSSSGTGLPQSVAEWRSIMDSEVKAFTSAAAAIGGDAETAAANVVAALKECGELIEMASVCAKPANIQGTVAALSSAMGKVNNQQKPRDRKDPAFMIIDLVQGAIPSLGWVVTEAQAWSTVDMNVEVMRYTGDKILTTYRRSDPKMVAYENTFSAIWKKVSPYVKEHHPAGLKWQQGGISTDKYQKGMVGSGPAPAARAPASSSAAPSAASGSSAGAAWTVLCNDHLAPFVSTCSQVGGPVAEQGPLLQTAYGTVAELLEMAAACQKPAGDDFQAVFSTLSERISAIDKVKLPKKRDDPVEWLQKCLNGGINALSFVCTPERSWEAVDANRDAMQFYGDKIYSRNRKDGPQLYVDFVDQYKKLLIETASFAKNFCPSGLEWNPNGVSTKGWTPGAAAAAPAPTGKGGEDHEPQKAGKGKGGKKGPPKGPPKSGISADKLAEMKAAGERAKAEAEAEKAAGGLSAREAMLAELENRQKSGVTAGFKHIDKAKKKSGGYKAEREKIVVDRSAAKTKAAEDRAAASKVQRAEVNERTGFDQLKLAYCKGTRQQKERRVIVVENPKKDAVTIQDCNDVIVEIQGIPKAVMITGCTKYHVSVPGCLTAVNVDNSNSGYMNITGVVRTCQVDKCKDLDVTLSPEAYECHFVSSKVSNLNVAIEQEGAEGTDLISMAVAAQFSTKLQFGDDGKPILVTVPTESGLE